MSTDLEKRSFRKYGLLALEAALLAVIVLGVSAYKARNLLGTDRQPAPSLTGVTLQGRQYGPEFRAGRPVLVYFFAPWCAYCSASADNLVRLRRLRADDKLEIVAVALDWSNRSSVAEYAEEHGLNVPVLLGDSKIASDWKVYGFPTYYVLDSEHRVVRRDIGYSTQFGLWWRSWVTN